MSRDSYSHPLLSMAQNIDEKGLMVFDVKRKPIEIMHNYGEPFTTPYMFLALYLEGWVNVECDMRPFCFRRHDIVVMPPVHIICDLDASPDYQAIFIVMSGDFIEKRKQDTRLFHDNFYYLTKPHIPLNEEQFNVVYNIFRLMQDISHSNSPAREEMLTNLLNTLILLLQDYRREKGFEEQETSAKEQLFARFYQAITQHYTESREVRYYAELFHLSPKYFASVIKQHTNTNALEWINGYVAVQAKMLLCYQRQLTVQEIALKLGFADQASFGRFFKKRIGMSPTEYREIT